MEGSDDSTGPEPLLSGTVTVIGEEAQIVEVTRWEDGALEGVEFPGSGRIEITIPRGIGENSDASDVYYTLDVSPPSIPTPKTAFGWK